MLLGLRVAAFAVLPIALPLPTLAEGSTRRPVPALYATKQQAEKAAKLFHCSGAHKMGEQWMPCDSHGESHSH